MAEETEEEQELREFRAAGERRYRSESGAEPPPNQPPVAAVEEAEVWAAAAREGRRPIILH